MGILLLPLRGISIRDVEFVYDTIKMENQWKRPEANFYTAFWMIIQSLK